MPEKYEEKIDTGRRGRWPRTCERRSSRQELEVGRNVVTRGEVTCHNRDRWEKMVANAGSMSWPDQRKFCGAKNLP